MGGSRVRSLSRPPPSHRYRTQFSFFALVPPEWGSFESLRVSVSVSKRRNGGFYAPVSASKISVPDSDVRDRFDDWVGGWQFGPFRLHHPVAPKCRLPSTPPEGPFLRPYLRVSILFLHQQGLDTSTTAGKAMFQMLGVFAEFERGIIRERVNAGLARARAKGTKLGRRRIEPAVEARILELKGEGDGMLKIGRKLGIGTSVVQRVFKQEPRPS